MLSRGYLATNNIYVSVAHTQEIVDEYLGNLEEVFDLLRICKDRNDFDGYLKGPVCHSGFKRLN